MKRKSKVKGLVITLVVIAILTAAGFGIWYFLQNRNSEPVNVFSFQYIGMTEYWGDNQESYGPVSTDRIQTVFLSDTQTVTEILVRQGDQVKKGDLLMTFDTTLTDIALERERLALEKEKLQLENARDELKQINKMKPMVVPTTTTQPETAPDLGAALSGDYQISENTAYDGSAQEKSLILWLRDSAQLNDAVFEAVRAKAEAYQEANVPAEPSAPEETEPTDPTDPTESTDPTDPAESTDPTDPTDPADPTTPSEPNQPPADLDVSEFYMIVKITEGNMSLASCKSWQGMQVHRSGDGFSFRFFDASAIQDHSVVRKPVSVPTTPSVDMGSGYTSKQIAQMRAEKEKQIEDLKFRVKMAEANYALKVAEAENGHVLAQIDGTVVSLLSEDEAKKSSQPILKVSGGGGFYVKGTVSELQKDQLQIGQEVTINDWNTGMNYTGSVQSIGDFPDSSGYWNGMGNPNVSYYPFTVFIDGSADLREGDYVNMVYSTATSQQGIYLENPFLRTEQGKTYVYVRGADGKLEQRFVTTGKALWGSYTEVLDGITAEDFLAFPYGKNVVPGADTVESDLSALYG